MLACVDVHYGEHTSAAVCGLFDDWHASEFRHEVVHVGPAAADYQPGEFYRRELGCILGVMRKAADPVQLLIIDGYAWLGTERKGLGAYVAEELQVPVIGVAKSPFAGASHAEVHRGESARPLLVTAEGLSNEKAAEHIRDMHGPFRLPTLLQRVDRLCRDAVQAVES